MLSARVIAKFIYCDYIIFRAADANEAERMLLVKGKVC